MNKTKTPKYKTRTYKSWMMMLNRCRNPNYDCFHHYGGKGIRVCKRWHKFENFLKDMGERPEGKTLDRIDSSRGYFKKNCRWATPKEQTRNTSRNVLITRNGETAPIGYFVEKEKADPGLVYGRRTRGWPTEKLFDPITRPKSNTGYRWVRRNHNRFRVVMKNQYKIISIPGSFASAEEAFVEAVKYRLRRGFEVQDEDLRQYKKLTDRGGRG